MNYILLDLIAVNPEIQVNLKDFMFHDFLETS